VIRTIDKFDDSLPKSTNLVDKLDDDMAELEQTTTHMAKMKDDKENGDDGIWMNEKDHNASKPLMDSNCFHMDIHECNHHEKMGCLKKQTIDAKMVNCIKHKKWEEGMAIELLCI
jgi:hypothetical protein